MPENIKQLCVLRKKFNLVGNLRIEPTPFYENTTQLPVLLFNHNNTICVEVGAIVSGNINVFTDFARKANELIAACEAKLRNDPAHTIKKIAIFSGFKPDTTIPARCIEVKNAQRTSSGYVKTMDDIKRFLSEDIYA